MTLQLDETGLVSSFELWTLKCQILPNCGWSKDSYSECRILILRRALWVILKGPINTPKKVRQPELFKRKYFFLDSVRTKLRAALAENVTLVQKVSNLGKEVSNTKSENASLLQKVSYLGKEVSNTKLDNINLLQKVSNLGKEVSHTKLDNKKLSDNNLVVWASLEKVQEENR